MSPEPPAKSGYADNQMIPDKTTIRSKTSRRYFACVALLLATAAGMQISAGVLKGYFQKLPLPLKRPLHLLNVARLAPEYVLHRNQAAPLSPEMLDTLGTEEYIQWNLVDQRVDRDSPAAIAKLFVTYHTGGLTMVPHRPQECMSAAGMILRNETVVELSIKDSQGRPHTLPLDVLEFEVPPRDLQLAPTGENAARMYVAYFFYTNGAYVTSRTQVRTAISNFTDKYAYYSKIEMSFNDSEFRRPADQTETVEAAARLLGKLMPILWDDHYQDWEAILGGAPPAAPDR